MWWGGAGQGVPPRLSARVSRRLCQVFLHFSKDQGREEEEDAQDDTEAHCVQRPKRISRFLEDPSMAETML